MKRILIATILLVGAAISASAQKILAPGEEVTVPAGYVIVDSLVYTPIAQFDESVKGEDIFSIVNVSQSAQLRELARTKIAKNSSRTLQGYRIRIFFDNKQTARNASEEAVKQFKASNPGISCYRAFTNPFFEVTVGDFRSKTEATAFLAKIKYQFPSAIIIKGKIAYPIVDNQNYYKVDTLRVLRPIEVKAQQ